MKFKKTVLISFLSILFFSFSNAQNGHSTPESVGLSAKHLENIDALFQESIEKKWMPGGTVLIGRKGKTAYFKAYGKSDLETGEEFQKDDIFRIASMTKAITTTAILQLYEKGLFRLDDPISNYIPAFKNVEVLKDFNAIDTSFTTEATKTAITFRHLLTHTSGITYDFMGPVAGAIYTKGGLKDFGLSHPTVTTAEMVDRITKLPLMHEPGTKWTYGLNMEVLGYLVQLITGQTLGEYCEAHIFKPLNMNDTHFYVPNEKADRVVPIYMDTKENGLQRMLGPVNDYPFYYREDHFAGGGGLSGTTQDYGNFCQMLLNDGQWNGNKILSRKTIELMTSDQLKYLNIEPRSFLGNSGTSFCLGYALATEKNTAHALGSAGTFSWGGAFNTKFWIDPKEDMYLVSMTQMLPFNHDEFWDRLYAIVYSAIND